MKDIKQKKIMVSLNLDEDVVEELTYKAKEIGISRPRLANLILAERLGIADINITTLLDGFLL